MTHTTCSWLPWMPNVHIMRVKWNEMWTDWMHLFQCVIGLHQMASHSDVWRVRLALSELEDRNTVRLPDISNVFGEAKVTHPHRREVSGLTAALWPPAQVDKCYSLIMSRGIWLPLSHPLPADRALSILMEMLSLCLEVGDKLMRENSRRSTRSPKDYLQTVR